MKNPKLKPSENKACDVESSGKTKILAQIGELQLLREAHARHIQDINAQMDKLKIQLANLGKKGSKDGTVQ